jgi:hypothetical protein
MQNLRGRWAATGGKSVHWVLNVVFDDDHSRIRVGYSPENLAVVLHIALNLLPQHQGKQDLSLKAKRLRAGWDTACLLQILSAM